MNKREIKLLWNKLTDFTHTYGQEDEVIDIINNFLSIPFSKDEYGNYFVTIGESKSLFVCHMDNAVKQKLKVTKINYTENNKHFVKTDGFTILGADDKTGIVIMLNMIDNKVPGTYYFFIGEEVGLVGSLMYHKEKPETFEKYERCIAFDRKGYGSIINRQKGLYCCSDDFVNSLISEFSKNGMEFKADPYGVGTDSASFMGIIPECVNLSVGYFDEHHYTERQDIDYMIELCDTTTKIDWENLPVVRVPEKYDSEKPLEVEKESDHLPEYKLQNIFSDVYSLCRRKLKAYASNHSLFEPGKEMKFYQVRDLDNINIFSMWVNWNGSIRFLKGDTELVFPDYKVLIDSLTKKPKKFKKTLGIERTEEEKELDRIKELREKQLEKSLKKLQESYTLFTKQVDTIGLSHVEIITKFNQFILTRK